MNWKKISAPFRLNILGTLCFNIKAFGVAKGLRLPVYIYGPVKAKSIGTIHILCPVRRRMIVIGTNYENVASSCTVFYNTGTIEVYGKVYIDYGTAFINKGLVIFRGNNLFGNECHIDIRHKLELGHDTFFGFETHITDSDHHYVVDVNTYRVFPNSAQISIGNYNWIGSNNFIKKGTVTPDYLIVASPCSMLSKDYSSLPPYTVLAGCPARPVKQGIRRIYSFKREEMISNFFRSHPDEQFYQIDKDTNLDEFCQLMELEGV